MPLCSLSMHWSIVQSWGSLEESLRLGLPFFGASAAFQVAEIHLISSSRLWGPFANAPHDEAKGTFGHKELLSTVVLILANRYAPHCIQYDNAAYPWKFNLPSRSLWILHGCLHYLKVHTHTQPARFTRIAQVLPARPPFVWTLGITNRKRTLTSPCAVALRKN